MRAPLSTAIAISVGLIILAGYFITYPLLQQVRDVMLGWGVILGGIATLVGIANLLSVHWKKLRSRRGRDFYSIFTILAFIATFAAGLVLGPSNADFQRVVTSIQEPIEISLLAVLAVTLAYAGLRLLQRRSSLMTAVFALSAIFFLIVSAGLFSSLSGVPILGDLIATLNRFPIAGMRGILLGIGLGSLTTGIRILLGTDRPYSG
jgi:hypothetical protein